VHANAIVARALKPKGNAGCKIDAIIAAALYELLEDKTEFFIALIGALAELNASAADGARYRL
jgi:hypothetical protein